MKNKRKHPEPISAETVETFGGDYHRLESTFRPRQEPPPEDKRGKGKNSAVDKEKRKDSRESRE
jgi:hypothetical protein